MITFAYHIHYKKPNAMKLYPLILGLGTGEVILIALIILLLFGAARIPALMKSMGKAIRKFALVFATSGDHNFGKGEKPGCAVDGSLDTKWLDFRAAHGADEASRSGVWIQLHFDEPTKISGYRWYTANDFEERDPRDWQLLGSNDEANWVLVDKVEDFEATSDRKALAFTAHL